MKKPNITPGPWVCEPAMEGQDCGHRIHTRDSAPYGMAHIYSPGANAKANAQAIAAVPDLLEALEPFAAYFSEVPTSGGNGTRVSPSFTVQQRQAARAALTKAGYTF